MLTIIFEAAFSIARSERVVKSVRRVEASAMFSLERLTREVRNAESIDMASSTLGVHPGRLVLVSIGEAGVPVRREFALSAGRLHLLEDGLDLGALTEEDVTVTSLKFHRFASTTVQGIRVEMSLESGTSTHYRSEQFYGAALLR